VVSALFTLRLAPARAMRRSALHTRHHPHSCCGANHARPATARVWSAAARGGSTPRVAQAQERLSERALREALCRGCACRAYFNYAGEPRGVFCAAHKADGMVDVVNKLCAADGCSKHPNFNFAGQGQARRATSNRALPQRQLHTPSLRPRLLPLVVQSAVSSSGACAWAVPTVGFYQVLSCGLAQTGVCTRLC